MLLLLAACGGGGGGAPAPAPAPAPTGPRPALPTVSQDLNPSGSRLDLRARNYFAGAPGDHWTFLQSVDNAAGTPFERNVSADGTGGDIVVTEGAGGLSSRLRYRRTAEGLLSIAPFEGQVPDSMNRQMSNLLEYPEPFYPVGSTRSMVRQGPMGEDFDGDGILDSFRLEVTQQLVGFEDVTLQSGGVVPQAAHFHNTWLITYHGSDRAMEPVTAVFVEHAWWAPGIGLVQARRTVSELSTLASAPVTTISITGGTVDGHDVFGPDGTRVVVTLSHNALVHDAVRQRYYASVAGDASAQANHLAVIDAVQGNLSYSTLAVGQDPTALAINADASALYVALRGTGEVVKLRLPDYAELWRVQLPAPSGEGQWLPDQVAVSPAGDVIAVSMQRTGGAHAGVALVRDGVLQSRMTAPGTGGRLLAFGIDGSTLFGQSDSGVSRLAVVADGVEASQQQALAGASGLPSIDVGPAGVVLGRGVYRPNDLSLVGQADVAGGGCRVAGATRLLCAARPADAFMPGDAALAIVDAATLAVQDAPVYWRGADPEWLSGIVPGPSGQVALRMRAREQDTVTDRIVLFSSDRLF